MERLASSYRDPAGFMFTHNEKAYRYIHPDYFEEYDLLFSSGLYTALTDSNRLVTHEVVNVPELFGVFAAEGKIIVPQQIPFISFAYEWPFALCRDAAIVTLKIALLALEHNMILKDATPFNIQFLEGRPVFIDTLSFEKYVEGKPWIAYRQFCECFLAPLLLMHYLHRDAGKIFLSYPDGIPAAVTKEMLPWRARLNPHVYLHIFLQEKLSSRPKRREHTGSFAKNKLQNLLRGLLLAVEKLTVKKSASEWENYYAETISGDAYLQQKLKLVDSFTNSIGFHTAIDLGSNDGVFSLLLKDKAKLVIATDGDSACINALYEQVRKNKIKNILPLVASLHNPSPAIGWRNSERAALTTRLRGDVVLALALVHHLAFTNYVPLRDIAASMSEMAPYLVIEFIPRDDEKVEALLKNKPGSFPEYNLENFRSAFSEKYEIQKENKILPTSRILFLMKVRT